MSVKTDISFNALYQRAILGWPEVMNVGNLIRYNKPAYQLPDAIEDLIDSIEKKYTAVDDEILMRGLKISISILIHKIAEYSTHVRPSEIRKDELKKLFERWLKEEKVRDDLSWTEDDYKLAELYFEHNK